MQGTYSVTVKTDATWRTKEGNKESRRTPKVALPNRTFCDDGNVLYLCCPRSQPLATCAIEYLKCTNMTEKWSFYFILISLHLNSQM